jgi:hypothetical protein
MSAIASTKPARSDAQIREDREHGMAVFRTALMLSMPLVGFITAPMSYAGMLGYAIREGRNSLLSFLAVLAFCLVHYGAMVLGAMWGFARFGGFGPGNILSATVAGFVVAAAFIAFIHPGSAGSSVKRLRRERGSDARTHRGTRHGRLARLRRLRQQRADTRNGRHHALAPVGSGPRVRRPDHA